MTDIVKTLRAWANGNDGGHCGHMEDAADEIERLRTALKEILEEVGASTKANKIASAALNRQQRDEK